MFKLEIHTGNAAFGNRDDASDASCLDEIARILRAAALRLEEGAVANPLYDINGNRVGRFTLTED